MVTTTASGIGLAALALGDEIGAAALIVAVVGVLITVVLWRRGRQRKAISYRLTTARVVSVRKEAGDRITVLYDGAPVSDVRLVDLHIECSGNVEIAVSDYDKPLVVKLGAGAQILSSAVSKRSPPDLDVKLHRESDSLKIDPVLLNEGDAFNVTALVSGIEGGVRLGGHVAGVPRFFDLDSEARKAGFVAAARRLAPPATSVLAGVLTTVAAGIALGSVFSLETPPSETLVRTKIGMNFCGHIINSNQQVLTMRLKGSGDLRQLRIAEVEAIREDKC